MSYAESFGTLCPNIVVSAAILVISPEQTQLPMVMMQKCAFLGISFSVRKLVAGNWECFRFCPQDLGEGVKSGREIILPNFRQLAATNALWLKARSRCGGRYFKRQHIAFTYADIR
ncbi:hypothetical protein HPB47_012775 [Ixodes persulcatus]|uniref:Uncharacterized protein n=1 Tax=Ixodes persulcatus TaxID=34615 RepID=A0AC60NSK2_IXOPE|nr:hypothetical protein HPB47_012775 [Ixodes persulcatus]